MANRTPGNHRVRRQTDRHFANLDFESRDAPCANTAGLSRFLRPDPIGTASPAITNPAPNATGMTEGTV